MSVVWLVDAVRFLQEYRNHIKNTPLKYVNWLVDMTTGYVRMYISGTNSNDIFCHIYEGNMNTMPVELRDVIRREGMILGTIDLSGIKGELGRIEEDTKIQRLTQA